MYALTARHRHDEVHVGNFKKDDSDNAEVKKVFHKNMINNSGKGRAFIVHRLLGFA